MSASFRPAAAVALASFVLFPVIACSGAPLDGVTGAPSACGSAALNPGETCDKEPEDDAGPSAPGCGNGVLDPGEACDTAIPAGAKGACATSCTSEIECIKATLVGSACAAHCVDETITQHVNGDRCCPAGATRATDTDCLSPFGGACTKSQDCATGICHIAPHCAPTGCTCTSFCKLNGALSECGGKGSFCAEPYMQGPTCTFVVDTGTDGDDKYVGLGSTTTGNINTAKDVDVFIFDAKTAGSYKVNVTPIDAAPIIDLAIDLYGEDGVLNFTVNDVGIGLAENYSMTVPLAQRVFIAVRTANTYAGNYRITVSAN